MSHLNYNHLYYFWMVCKQGSVAKAAKALFLTPQTVTGQIKAFESRMNGKLLKPSGRSVQPTELGELVFQYADKMFDLSYEMLDIVNYSRVENILFDVGVADALSKNLVSQILSTTVPPDQRIHLRCFESSTHERLLEQLSQHKLDMILSDCPVNSSQTTDLYHKKLGECKMSFFSYTPIKAAEFPAVLEKRKLLLPGSSTTMGRVIMHYFDKLGVTVDVLGEFDDAALMQAFARQYPDSIFVAPTQFSQSLHSKGVHCLGEIEGITESYYVIFAKRMIQHPAVKNICEADFSYLF